MKQNTRLAVQFIISLVFLTFFFYGCSSVSYKHSHKYVHPRVAVFKFENKAGRPMKWDLGTGMADVMVNRLMEVNRFTLVEREDVNAIVKELSFQKTGITRSEGKVPHHRMLNVQYLIKGTVTDFSHVGRGEVGIGSKSTQVRSRGSSALVSMVITVIDIESGEILLSTTVSSKVYSRGFDVTAAYNDVAFGGYAFYRTPLGKATQDAMDRAITHIVKVIGSEIWRPAIITIEEDAVILNGGRDRRLKVGALYHIIEPGEGVYDTETGNSLGRKPGEKIGILEVTEVNDKYSSARLYEGDIGQTGYFLYKLSRREAAAFRKIHGLKD